MAREPYIRVGSMKPFFSCGYKFGSSFCTNCPIQTGCPNRGLDMGPQEPILPEYIECFEGCKTHGRV